MLCFSLFGLSVLLLQSSLSLVQAQVHPLVGEWSPNNVPGEDGTCSVENSECCCADSPMIILPGKDINELVFSGRVIGDGCRGQTYLSGNFSILSATKASIKQFGQTLNATLQPDDTIQMITSANDCINVFVRKEYNSSEDDLPPIRVLPVMNETGLAHRWINQGEYYQVEALFAPSKNIIWSFLRFLIQSELYQLSLGGTERLGQDSETGIWYSRAIRLPADAILTYSFLYNDNTSTYNSSFYILNASNMTVTPSAAVDLSGEEQIDLTTSSSDTEESSEQETPPAIIGADDVVDSVWSNAREKWIGNYRSDGSCVPTNRCCCSTNDIAIKIPDPTASSSQKAIYVESATDGGVACFRREKLSGMCFLVNQDQAHCEGQESSDAPVIFFNLSLADSELRIENSMYECDSVGIKIVEGMDTTSSVSGPTHPSLFTSWSILLALLATTFF